MIEHFLDKMLELSVELGDNVLLTLVSSNLLFLLVLLLLQSASLLLLHLLALHQQMIFNLLTSPLALCHLL